MEHGTYIIFNLLFLIISKRKNNIFQESKCSLYPFFLKLLKLHFLPRLIFHFISS